MLSVSRPARNSGSVGVSRGRVAIVPFWGRVRPQVSVRIRHIYIDPSISYARSDTKVGPRRAQGGRDDEGWDEGLERGRNSPPGVWRRTPSEQLRDTSELNKGPS